MGSFSDLSALVNRATGGNSGSPEPLWWYKDNRVSAAAAVATIAGRYTSLWQYDGAPAHGSAPGAVAAPDNATAGGLLQTDPGGGRQKWLLMAQATASAAGTLILYDRLLHISGLSGTSTSAQTVGGSLSRYTGTASKGNEIWIEIYTQIGNTSTTITASYTDQDGNTGQTTQATAFGNTAFREAQRIIRLPLAQGDSGVRAVADVTLALSTGVTGDFGVNIVRPLVALPIVQAGIGALSSYIDGPIEILTDACLAMAWLPNGTSAPQVSANFFFAEA